MLSLRAMPESVAMQLQGFVSMSLVCRKHGRGDPMTHLCLSCGGTDQGKMHLFAPLSSSLVTYNRWESWLQSPDGELVLPPQGLQHLGVGALNIPQAAQ